MRTKLLSATILAAGLATATAASAQDFAGPYMGGQIGYDSYDVNFADGGDAFSLSANGIEGGIFAGYNFQMQNFVVGLEGQVSLSDADSTVTAAGFDFDLQAKESYGLSARAGALIAENALLYVHGGWTKTKFETSVVGIADADENARLDGWKAGVGLEMLVTENTSARAEYIYTDYETSGLVEPKNSAFQFGVSWHF